MKDASQQGKGKGDTFHWNVYSEAATQGTKLTETKTVPETNFVITQGTLTIDEYGNSVPYSGKLDDLSEHPVKEIINKVLKRDAARAFDIAAFTQFNNTALRCNASGGTSSTAISLETSTTCTTTNSVAMLKGHVAAISDTMKERDIPPYTGDDYYAISHPTTFTSFKTDLEGIQEYTPEGFGMIMKGEMGRYRNVRFVEQTNIPKGGAIDDATFDPDTKTGAAWDSATSSWCFFFGEDTCAEAICQPEEMRGKIPTDYGRSKGVAWYYLGGFGIVHTAQLQTRIIKWDSAS